MEEEEERMVVEEGERVRGIEEEEAEGWRARACKQTNTQRTQVAL